MSPKAISPFQRGKMWWARVPRPNGYAVQRSLGTTSKDTADAMCRFLEWLRGRRDLWLLEQLAAGASPVGLAYDAWTENRLPAYVAQLRHGTEDVDLEPYVAKWQKELERRKRPGVGGRAKYLAQVRTLLAAGQPFRRSELTRARVMAWLQGLGVGQPNRYRAALSSFAEYLIDLDVLDRNPVRQVKMAREADPRTLHLSVADATALVDALHGPYQALHATMLATGMEVSAALAVRRRDVDLDALTVYARGTKRASRERTCHVYATWLPVFGIVREHIAAHRFTPDALLFQGLDVWGALRALRAALAAKQLPTDYRTHDHRHTWAVQALRDGIDDHAIAYQLGHGDARMLRKVYGRYVPRRSDFDRNATSSATAPLMRSMK